jgi:hypothetical protein
MVITKAADAIDFLRDHCDATTEAKMNTVTGEAFIQVLVPIENLATEVTP